MPQHLSIPYVAMTRFVDPAVNFGVSFEKAGSSSDTSVVDPAPASDGANTPEATSEASDDSETVISLDAFRRK